MKTLREVPPKRTQLPPTPEKPDRLNRYLDPAMMDLLCIALIAFFLFVFTIGFLRMFH